MRKFFSFGLPSLATTNNESSPKSCGSRSAGVNSGEGAEFNNISRIPDESGPKSQTMRAGREESPALQLKRSLSFSSLAADRFVAQGHLHHSGGSGGSPCASPESAYVRDCPVHGDFQTSDGCRGRGNALNMDNPDDMDSCSPCQLPDTSIFPGMNDVLDRYIDGEHESSRGREHRRHGSRTGKEVMQPSCKSSNASNLGKPPRAHQSMETSSPTSTKESSLRTYSFREGKDHRIRPQLNLHSHLRDCRENFPHFYSGELAHARDNDSETTSVEDIYEDFANPVPFMLSSGTTCQKPVPDTVLPYALQSVEEGKGFLRRSSSVKNVFLGSKHERPWESEFEEHGDDETLLMKAKEMEERLLELSEENFELELHGFSSKRSKLVYLEQTVKRIVEERKYLASELCTEIKSRLSERFAAKVQQKQAREELCTRTRRLEKEKNELQMTLEKELDRRCKDWAFKFDKCQSEDQRLRDRVRELAEQNVSLQRELSSLQLNQADVQSKILNSEVQIDDMTMKLEELKKENDLLSQSLSEMQGKTQESEKALHQLRKVYKEKEEEAKDLQKLLVRLQQTCNDQEKTIMGLRQSFSEEFFSKYSDGSDVGNLRSEQLRLTGVEQTLRREIESIMIDMESLRHENISLLTRLQSNRDKDGLHWAKVDQELRSGLDFLQAHGLSLLDEIGKLADDLLEFIKCKKQENYHNNIDSNQVHSLLDYTLSHQRMRNGIENFRRNLRSIISISDEKMFNAEARALTPGDVCGNEIKGSEVEMKYKAEVMLSKLLREKLFNKELEIEGLREDFASLMRGYDVLQNEIQRLQDEYSCLRHKSKDMEHQMLKRDEMMNQLEQDLRESLKELSAVRSTLKTTNDERDMVCRELRQLKINKENMSEEANILRKRIEALEEDVLLKEGQIAILKDSLERPFNFCSPKSMKEFGLE